MLLDEKPRRLRRSARVCSEKKKAYSGFVRSAKNIIEITHLER